MENKSNQVVEVVFPGGKKTYSYIGSGNLRTGQHIDNAPVNHYMSGKPYTAPVTVVATHNVVGAKVGDNIGVSNNQVHSIRTGLKYLPGAKEYNEDRSIDVMKNTPKVSEYMSEFEIGRNRILNSISKNKDMAAAKARLLGV